MSEGIATSTVTILATGIGEMIFSDFINESYSVSSNWTPPSLNEQTFITWDTKSAFRWYLSVIVHPIIGVLGILGNSINMIVLRRNNLNKPSNVLLYCLAIADICTLATAVDVVGILTQFPKKTKISWRVWEYECSQEDLPRFYLNFTRVIYALAIFGANISPCICVLIALERIVAVFLPLKFTLIIRAKRIWIVILFLVVVWIAFTLMITTEFHFTYTYLPQYNVCTCSYTVLLSEAEDAVDVVATWLAFYVSFGFVLIGSLIIYAKLKFVGIKRRQISSSKTQHSSRTTQTLLTVCLVFSVTQILRFPYAMFKLPFQSRDSEAVYRMFLETTSYLNSSSNFIIYVVLNNKFRTVFRNMFVR